MVDQEMARLWAEHHEDFGRWVDGVTKSVRQAFRALNRIQYDAPWTATAHRRARH